MSFLTVSAVDIHRVSLGDNPTVSTFNGKQYKKSDGWIPGVLSHSYSFNSGTIVLTAGGRNGLNWRINATGFWELYGDIANAIETWKVDLVFTAYAPGDLPIAATDNFIELLGTIN